MKRDFLTFEGLSKDDFLQILNRASELKKLVKSKKCPTPLSGKTLGLIFEKSSTRTRVSFEVAMYHLGGRCIYLNQEVSQLGRGESYADTARVLSRYIDVLVMRTFSQESLAEMAKYSTIPVINGLTDSYHPCQILADLLTVLEVKGGDIQNQVISYVGDGNNITHSWIEAAALIGFELRVGTPDQYAVDPEIKKLFSSRKNIIYTKDPIQAVKDCDVINTDTWVSMGQKDSDEKKQTLQPFQVNQKLLSFAKKDAIVLHCLPAHRGEEITAEVIDGKQSVIFDEAENRLYVQMAVLEMLLKSEE